MGGGLASQAPDVESRRPSPGSSAKKSRKCPTASASIRATYDPVLGHSYAEIAGMSRSMHRSQGMGAAERKGSAKDFLVTQSGPVATQGYFRRHRPLLESHSRRGADWPDCSPKPPKLSIRKIPIERFRRCSKRKSLMAALHDPLVALKQHELNEAIVLCSGLWLDAASDKFAVTPGGSLKVRCHRAESRPYGRASEIGGHRRHLARHHQGQVRRRPSFQ